MFLRLWASLGSKGRCPGRGEGRAAWRQLTPLPAVALLFLIAAQMAPRPVSPAHPLPV